MKANFSNHRILLFLVCLASLGFAACSGGSANPFAGKDRQVDENIENLMGLAVGMTKNQVYELCGVANYIEGYDYEEIVEITGISYANCRTTISRAKEQLRKKLGTYV